MILEYIIREETITKHEKNTKSQLNSNSVENLPTINQILSQEFGLSNRLFNRLLNSQKIYLNDIFVDTRTNVKIGDKISIDLNYDEDNSNIVPTKMDLNIIFEDESMLIISKPRGIAVHPSILHFENSLSNGVKYYFDSIGLHKKIRPVNRLDFNTSGLIVFAKNEYIQECLIKQMTDGSFHKKYWAIAHGIFENKTGTINAPIARKENSIIERCVSEHGKLSITDYKVLEEFNNYSLLECTLKTGRTHQIRVHMAYIGHPLVGDTLYGTASNLIDGQALHSYEISFIHPVLKKACNFKDDSFLNILEILKKESSTK